jgi:hypothetical protein
VRAWISAPETGEVLAQVTFPVAADGSWSGAITIPESAAAFSAVDVQASCSDTTGETVVVAAAAAYRLYTPVRFTMTASPATPASPSAPAKPAKPATPVRAQPSFVG